MSGWTVDRALGRGSGVAMPEPWAMVWEALWWCLFVDYGQTAVLFMETCGERGNAAISGCEESVLRLLFTYIRFHDRAFLPSCLLPRSDIYSVQSISLFHLLAHFPSIIYSSRMWSATSFLNRITTTQKETSQLSTVSRHRTRRCRHQKHVKASFVVRQSAQPQHAKEALIRLRYISCSSTS